MKFYGQEFYVIAKPEPVRFEEWKGEEVCLMHVIFTRTHSVGPLRGVVRAYEGWVRPIHIVDEVTALEASTQQEVNRKLCFETREEAERALFMRRLRGDV